jgi:3-dehydroquinate synthase
MKNTRLETLQVELGDRSYPIHIGEHLLSRADLLTPHIGSSQVCIVTNETIAPLYLDQLVATLSGYKVKTVILPDGEAFKTLETVTAIYDALLEHNFSRSCTLIALGGGVIGDMTGFAAATYQRGVNFIQIPTTLLSQVDSSVGGKTGVNRPLGKNMVGAFYQPRCVLADISTLATLPDRELKAGLAEVIKYGFINNRRFHEWLNSSMSSLLQRDSESLRYAIRISCEEKAAIVAADEKEDGIRATLNLGHTFGHAIETALGYGAWLHGEAVGVGMVMAADLSVRLGYLDAAEAGEIKALVVAAGLPAVPPELAVDTWVQLMSKDKKADQGNMKFILLNSIGEALIDAQVPRETLIKTLQAGPALAQF